jgi:hypothetical protein
MHHGPAPFKMKNMKKLAKIISVIFVLISVSSCGSDDSCNIFDNKLVCSNGSRYELPRSSHCTSGRDESGAFVECNGERTYIMDGAPGVDGMDGINGQDGVNGLDGLSGQDGNDGMSGDDGTVFDPSGISFSRGGSRIKITSFVGNDGSILSQGFYDTQLGCDCYPSRYHGDTQSEYRCVCSGGNVLNNLFSDENCTQRLSITNNSGIASEWIHINSIPYVKLYVGVYYTGNVYSLSSSNCSFSEYYTEYYTYGTLYSVGREMQPSEFVGFSRTRN